MTTTINLPPQYRFRGWDQRTWPIRIRFALLMPFNCKWNVWVRDFTAWLEYLDGEISKVWSPPTKREYPYEEGDFLVIGPECFTPIGDHSVICYKGENYVPQPAPKKKRAK